MTDWGLLGPAGVDDDAVLVALVDVERALLDAWGAVTGAATDSALLDLDALDRVALARGRDTDGVPVVALVAQLRAQVAGTPTATWLHRGATSQDILDSALMLLARRSIDAAVHRLVRVGDALAAVAHTEAASPAIARTLARHAAPTTLGATIGTWLDGVSSAVAGLDALSFPVQLGGAVGTGAAFDAVHPGAAIALRDELALRLSLTNPGRAWHTDRTPVMQVSAAVAAAIAALGRIGRDATLLSREEIAEITLSGGGASSAMPHKRNPVTAVALVSAAVRAPGLIATIAAAGFSADARAAGEWHAEWPALRELLRIGDDATAAAVALTAGLGVDRAAARWLDAAPTPTDLHSAQTTAERAIARWADTRKAVTA